jgi:predicted dehydrogenase
MKPYYLLILSIICFLSSCNKGTTAQMIETPAPPRAAGQTDVLELRTDPVPIVRVAFIGLGMRGSEAVKRMTYIDSVQIVALCDVEKEKVEAANETLEKRGLPKAQEFYGDEEVWRKVTALPNVDLVYICTDWKHHAPIGIQAMKDGKHVAIEVPAATSMKEIWDLINTSEQTRKHCMQLENCVYDFFELTTLNMVQQGLLGDIVHGEGAYIHNLNDFWDQYWNNWRMDFNRSHRGDVYPTHGLGPVCLAMNIHRGDKLDYLVSMDTKPVKYTEYIKNKTGKTVTDFRNGDHTSTLIATEKGKSILIEHSVVSPRPYTRMYQLTGTKGFANKYPVQGFALDGEGLSDEIKAVYPDANPHTFVPDTVRKLLMQKYKHPIAAAIEEKAKEVGGHGGMDFIMDYRLIHCLRNGLPLDMDVYDLAEWCCLVPLTEVSLDHHSMPVQIPDFTRGAWNKLSKLTFAE